jgi:enoyl-CoA hydratase
MDAYANASSDLVHCREEGSLGLIMLNRPDALNALNLEMCQALYAQLKAWAQDPRIAVVGIYGEGRAFCAGGDVRVLAKSGSEDGSDAEAFFRAEYQLNTLIKEFPKPYVALLHGAVMGGGVGISAHGTFRIALPKLTWAMPEAIIGMVTDVGTTHLLPRLGKGFGRWIALTGARLDRDDAAYLGLLTHTLEFDHIDALWDALSNTEPECSAQEVQEAIESCAQPADGSESALGNWRDVLMDTFAHRSVEDIYMQLSKLDADWARQAEKAISDSSPFALKAIYAMLQRGEILSFRDAISTEFRVTSRMVRRHDFSEGVRARLIEKDNAPQWSPATLAEVSDSEIAALFEPADNGDLELS